MWMDWALPPRWKTVVATIDTCVGDALGLEHLVTRFAQDVAGKIAAVSIMVDNQYMHERFPSARYPESLA